MDRSKQGDVANGLEASLIQIINSHHSSSLKLRESTEKAKKDAIRTARRVSKLLVDSVDKEVQESFVMQNRIEMEIRALAASICNLESKLINGLLLHTPYLESKYVIKIL